MFRRTESEVTSGYCLVLLTFDDYEVPTLCCTVIGLVLLGIETHRFLRNGHSSSFGNSSFDVLRVPDSGEAMYLVRSLYWPATRH